MDGERADVLGEWPRPAAGVPEPQILANDTSLSLLYRTADDRYAMVHFPLCFYLAFGAPNDEALSGHPLWRCGLQHYSVHEIQGSTLIRELELRNSIHPRHARSYLKGMRHYVFTFHDTTLECVVASDQSRTPTITLFERFPEAELAWRAARQA